PAQHEAIAERSGVVALDVAEAVIAGRGLGLVAGLADGEAIAVELDEDVEQRALAVDELLVALERDAVGRADLDRAQVATDEARGRGGVGAQAPQLGLDARGGGLLGAVQPAPATDEIEDLVLLRRRRRGARGLRRGLGLAGEEGRDEQRRGWSEASAHVGAAPGQRPGGEITSR